MSRQSWIGLVIGSALALLVHFPVIGAETSGQAGPADGHVKIKAPMPIVNLAKTDLVRNEIGLTNEQSAKLQNLMKEITEALREKIRTLQKLPLQERSEKEQAFLKEVAEDTERYQKKLEEILLARQLERAQEILLQSQGVNALFRPEVVKALGITDEQKEKIKSITSDAKKALAETSKGMPNPALLSKARFLSDMRELNEKTAPIKKEVYDKALQILTTKQRAMFEKMKGKKIDAAELDDQLLKVMADSIDPSVWKSKQVKKPRVN